MGIVKTYAIPDEGGRALIELSGLEAMLGT